MLRIGWANVVRSWADKPIVLELFDDVGGPTAYAGNGKHRCEQIYVNAKSVVGRSGIEVHVGVEFFVGLHEFFDSFGGVKPLALATGFAEIAGHGAKVSGPRIFGVVHAVTEARNLFL